MQAAVTATATLLMASRANTHWRWTTCRSRPERAGPPTMPTWSTTCMVANAASRRPGVTSDGATELQAVEYAPPSCAERAGDVDEQHGGMAETRVDGQRPACHGEHEGRRDHDGAASHGVSGRAAHERHKDRRANLRTPKCAHL